jgi:hypothetical protein
MSQPQGSRAGVSRHRNGDFDMHAAARRVLSAAGFEPDLDGAAKRQLETIKGPAPFEPGVKDLRHLS